MLKNKAFTLIEIMVVVAIIGVLASILAPQVADLIQSSKITKTCAELKTIKNALKTYSADTGSYPPSVQDWGRAWGADVGLFQRSNVHSTHLSAWNGPYLEEWPQKTAWGPIVGCGAQGVYYVHIPIGWIDIDGIGGNDYWIHMDPGCGQYPSPVAIQVDRAIDDGNPGGGSMRVQGPASRTYMYYFGGEGRRDW